MTSSATDLGSDAGESAAGLSIEARVVAGAFWGVLPTKELTFKRPHILTAQSRKGLDDLVAAKMLTVETHKHSGAMTWRPAGDDVKKIGKSVSRKFIEANTFKITTE